MLELLVLAGAISAIAGIANGRGGTGWKYATVAAVGWLIVAIPLRFMAHQPLAGLVLSWLIVGGVALYVRFGLASGQEIPGGTWSCPGCFSLNRPSSLVCEACRQPWSKSVR